MKRIFLFLAVNILVVTTISIILNVLNVQPYLNAYGLNYQSLAIFCLIWGFSGALISLALSRVMAKMMMGVQIIDDQVQDSDLRWLVMTVHRLARSAGLTTMPEVGIYDSPEINAFATGPTRNRSLVAVSSGLLQSMDQGEIEGVLGHEIAHVANGDMVTMTLLQGVVNSFVMFISRIIAFALSQNVKEENRHTVRWITTIVLDIVLTLLGSMVVAWFSRWREFRADKGGAQFASRTKMISALQALQRRYEGSPEDERTAAVASFKISGKQGGLMALFATHPPLSDRIEALKSGA